jgi:hypothetical protein
MFFPFDETVFNYVKPQNFLYHVAFSSKQVPGSHQLVSRYVFKSLASLGEEIKEHSEVLGAL